MSGKTLILTCNSSFGLANFRMGLIRRLQSEGYHVVAVAPRDAHSVQLEAAGVEFYDWHLSARSARPLQEVRAIVQLMQIYRRVRPSLSFHYTVKAVIYGAIAARRAQTRFVSVITGLGYIFLNDGVVSRVARALYRLVLKRSHRVWFLNRADVDEFVRFRLVDRSLAEVIPGEGVDTAHFRPGLFPSRPVGLPTDFLMVSRLLADKGVYEFVDAVRLLRSRGWSFTARILGARGAENPTAITDNVVDGWVHEGLIEYLGTAIDVRSYLAQTDCVVLPSYREGVPRALLEASAMEVPVVATDVPGCRDVVVDGVTGYLCAARDPTALADAMEHILRLATSDREALGKRGRELIERKFSEPIVIQRYLRLLEA